ncbi:MAG TPA: UvrD-helicase domain-containing protein [Planctomycetaceae bacterium]|nr:UvrD-helicase domain-containing protein [Planctomycetaceae bacterium]
MDDLTPSQRRAVEQTEGPLLVVAGPGSGKTRVITRRIARIVEQGVSPGNILALTFTNKAAGEMGERVARLLPGTRVWVSTFHRFCARLLRRRAQAVGLKPNFTILDMADQRRFVRDIVRSLNFDSVHFPPERIADRISRAKNDLLTPESFQKALEERVGTLMDSVVKQVYPEYQRRLLDSNAVDFDDLLLWIVRLLEDNEEIRSELDEHFRYVMVDEYQDTNRAQYAIVAALSRDFPNLCVTGDPDQSIYGWRGARIENILRFEADYPRAAVVRLEENFRSTKSILRAADALIAHNVRRKAKTMRTDNPEGMPVELLRFDDAQSEAQGVAQAIRLGAELGQLKYSDVAIFYRINALSREFEIALARNRVPFQVAAGQAFYDRTEVKDVLGYLRLIANPQDRSAFLRVVNVPARGIGKKSIDRLTAWADAQRMALLAAAEQAPAIPGLPRKGALELARFAHLIGELADKQIVSIAKFVELVLQRTAYMEQWRESPTEQDQQREANVSELLNAAAQYDTAEPDHPTLEGFLETTALVADIDSVDQAAERVTLMTLHAAKGLEFPIVYLVGVEQRLLPYERALQSDDPGEYEEERRLMFVGMTRARERLWLTRTQMRAVRGQRLASIPSEFLREVGVVETALSVSAPRSVETGMSDGEQGEHEGHEPAPDYENLPELSPDDESTPSERAERAARKAAMPHAGAGDLKHRGLMTGADLLAAAAAREPEAAGGFTVGMSVRHPRYGVGKVVKVSGLSRNRLITIQFDDDGRTETFVAGKNPLQPVGAG